MSDHPISIDHCVIHVSDWEIARDFYGRVFGARSIELNGGYVFRIGDCQLNCHGPGKHASPVARFPVQPGNSDICFEWKGPIEGAVGHLRTQDVDVELGPVERFGAKGTGSSIDFRDPDGSLLEFISYES